MLAPRLIPPNFRVWNRQHRAPFGRELIAERWLAKVLPAKTLLRLRGPFSVQPNNTIRRFEYPWAYHAADLAPGMRVLEIGGGLSGFQIALAKAGCDILNVDPGLEAKGVGWKCDSGGIAEMNRAFHTDVELRNATVQTADLEEESFDRAFSISVLEHLPDAEIVDVMNHVYRVLKPGGWFVLTVDLFLELIPFTSRHENRWGKNVNIRELVEATPLQLRLGDPEFLYGFDAFDADRIQANLSDFLVGAYPAMAQCLVLEKPNL